MLVVMISEEITFLGCLHHNLNVLWVSYSAYDNTAACRRSYGTQAFIEWGLTGGCGALGGYVGSGEGYQAALAETGRWGSAIPAVDRRRRRSKGRSSSSSSSVAGNMSRKTSV